MGAFHARDPRRRRQGDAPQGEGWGVASQQALAGPRQDGDRGLHARRRAGGRRARRPVQGGHEDVQGDGRGPAVPRAHLPGRIEHVGLHLPCGRRGRRRRRAAHGQAALRLRHQGGRHRVRAERAQVHSRGEVRLRGEQEGGRGHQAHGWGAGASHASGARARAVRVRTGGARVHGVGAPRHRGGAAAVAAQRDRQDGVGVRQRRGVPAPRREPLARL
mmetsp:Transcript_51514/g.125637  ORF Transcript_51514/g.125637 Transcript_51514/m.125637 type:complete len:218 (+) Transcript_51514:354-1007(+)